MKTAAYGLYMRAPSGQCFNYGEAAEAAPLQPVQFWLAQQEDNPWAAWRERSLLVDQSAKPEQSSAFLPALLIWSYPHAGQAPPPPPNPVWVGGGQTPVALLRSSWEDSTALFMGLKAGTPSLPDAHMDVGSFVAEAQGVRWAIDLGRQDVDSLRLTGVDLEETGPQAARWLLFRHSVMGHNTLVVNHAPQVVSGFAPIVRYSSQAPFMHAITDLTALYGEALVSAQRGVAILEGRSMLVQDELETGSEAAVVRWAFVTGAEVELVDAQRAILRQGGKKLVVALESGSGLTLRTWSTGPRYEHDSANPGTVQLGFETTLPPRTKQAWRVSLLPGSVSAEITSPLVLLRDWPRN